MAHKPQSDRSDLRRRGSAPFVTRSAMNDERRGKSRWDFCDTDGTTRQGHRIRYPAVQDGGKSLRPHRARTGLHIATEAQSFLDSLYNAHFAYDET